MSENNVLVIFGATGDLTFQKLLPALNRLLILLPNALSKVIVVGRQVDSLDAYLQYGDDHGLDRNLVNILIPKLTYLYLQAGEPGQYQSLATLLSPFSNRFFYLATPPSMFALITEALATSHCIEKGNPHHRCAYEKPFGDNQVTASILNDLLHEHLDESQLYRVDHYLAKPLIQNLVKIRMQWASLGMEKFWQNTTIKAIDIHALETVSILARGKFYDATGALKDMIQSHLLQTLALFVMDLPARIDDIATIQQQKSTLLAAIKPVQERIVFGQYVGYLQEDHVAPTSITETFVHLPLSIQSPRWQGVEVTLTTGKKLPEKRTDLVVTFTDGIQCIFQISPVIKISFTGDLAKIFPPALVQHCQALSKHPFAQEEAYVTVFKDFLLGNQTLFPTSKDILAMWHIVDEIKATPRLPIRYRHLEDVLPGGTRHASIS